VTVPAPVRRAVVVVAGIAVLVVSSARTALAQVVPDPAPDPSLPGGALITQVLGWLKYGAIAAAVAGLLIGGITIGVGHFGIVEGEQVLLRQRDGHSFGDLVRIGDPIVLDDPFAGQQCVVDLGRGLPFLRSEVAVAAREGIALCVACACAAGAHLMRVACERVPASCAQSAGNGNNAGDAGLSRWRWEFCWALFGAGFARL